MPEEIADAFRLARRQGLSVTARGTGLSYNDASLNGGGHRAGSCRHESDHGLECRAGQVMAEPGVTLRQLWQQVEPDGWWPPVVSGTMLTTSGAVSAPTFTARTISEWDRSANTSSSSGPYCPRVPRWCARPRKNADLFYAMIGGFGMLGIFTSIKLQMKRIYSGLLEVSARPARNLHEQLADLLRKMRPPPITSSVGWMGPLAAGLSAGAKSTPRAIWRRVRIQIRLGACNSGIRFCHPASSAFSPSPCCTSSCAHS